MAAKGFMFNGHFLIRPQSDGTYMVKFDADVRHQDKKALVKYAKEGVGVSVLPDNDDDINLEALFMSLVQDFMYQKGFIRADGKMMSFEERLKHNPEFREWIKDNMYYHGQEYQHYKED